MAPIKFFPRSNLVMPLFLACLFCLGITDAFINSNAGGVAGATRTITTTTLLPTPNIHQSLPSGSNKVVPPFPLRHASSSDDSLLDASSLEGNEESELVVGSRRWKLILLRIASLVSKNNGGLRKRLRKQALIFSFVLSAMSYRVGLFVPAAYAEETLSPPVTSDSSEKVNSIPEKSSSNIGKVSGATVLVASGAHVFRLNRKQKRQNEAMASFESWNASWNSTTAATTHPNDMAAVAVNSTTTTSSSSSSSGYYMPTMERYKFVQTDCPTDATTTSWNNNNNNNNNDNNDSIDDINDGLVLDSSSDKLIPKDDVMKATVEAMKQAGGESTELFVQEQNKNSGDDKEEEILPLPPIDDSSNETVTPEPTAKLEKEEKEESSSGVTNNKKGRDEQKYPKERMPVKDPVERAKIQAKYAAIESLEDRAFQILLDLGMIENTGD